MSGVYVNEVHQAYLQVLAGLPQASITTHNYPLPMTYSEQQFKAAGDAVVTSTFLMIAFCFVPGKSILLRYAFIIIILLVQSRRAMMSMFSFQLRSQHLS